MDAPSVAWPIARFCRQYLQIEPDLDYPDGSLLRPYDTQEFLYETLFAPAADGQGSELPPAYALRVLKTLVGKIEDSIDDWDQYDVSDKLMTRLAELASSGLAAANTLGHAMQKHRVTYYLAALEGTTTTTTTPPPPTITLAENRSTFAAAGTTGLRTWEASMHLGVYLCRDPALVRGKRVLELGAGTGYVSILCAKYLGAARCVASDGWSEVIDNMPANLRLNGLDTTGAAVTPLMLRWGEEEEAEELAGDGNANENGAVQADVVLGADVTFDAADMPALLSTIRRCVATKEDPVILIAVIERNRATVETFTRLASTDFHVDMTAFPIPKKEEQTGPFYSDTVPIHICRLWPKSRAGLKMERATSDRNP
ncbi:FAM86A protein [Niveomyces insectorum RCEF 264]|uniref:FAM86A protein n=1 Tax=Niveomyces insectorum RCEF 264 TaxID=1081102 RepID=A0A167Y4H2_9HYPO|nr:FAM86A protein [Niveomyces insectorum RCEF 264]